MLPSSFTTQLFYFYLGYEFKSFNFSKLLSHGRVHDTTNIGVARVIKYKFIAFTSVDLSFNESKGYIFLFNVTYYCFNSV